MGNVNARTRVSGLTYTVEEDRSEERDFNNLEGTEGVENGPSRPEMGTVPGREIAILMAVSPGSGPRNIRYQSATSKPAYFLQSSGVAVSGGGVRVRPVNLCDHTKV